MNNKIRTISVIGDGGWGTTIALHLLKQKHNVTLWGPFPEYVKTLQKNRVNAKFLPGKPLPKSLTITDTLKEALETADIIVFAIPSKFALTVLKKIKKTKINLNKKMFLSLTKGFDTKSLLRLSEIIIQELGTIPLAVLSGPTIAIEVANQIPSTAVIASQKIKTAKTLQEVFNSDTFRIYTNTDVLGVELGGSIKNIIAVACGICDGLKLGTNTKAAILTRGLAEMARLGKAMGARSSTFSGLSGLGDLATTCFSPNSRNRYVGEELGKGKSAKQILSSMQMVAEGVETVKAAYKLSQKYKVDMPISEEIYNIIYKNKKPAKALNDLMSRKTKAE